MLSSRTIGENYLVRRSRKSEPVSSLFSNEDLEDGVRFFRALPGYKPTPLHRLRGLANQLGIAEVYVKDESSRLDLNSFKTLGVAYAVAKMQTEGMINQNTTLVCATDGNHGRAVARAAHQRGLSSQVYVHENVVRTTIDALEKEGANVIVVKGNYDDAWTEAQTAAERRGWTIISDTSWGSYQLIPRYIMTGYAMLFEEAAAQWPKNLPPTVVLIQVGVGGLLGTAISWYHQKYSASDIYFIACEPTSAACLLRSMSAGRPVTLDGGLQTTMAGLSCGTVSHSAWPVLRDGVDACVAVSDRDAANAMWRLARPCAGDPSIEAGESGACGIAALTRILQNDDFRTVREACEFSRQSRAFVINTEGATDICNYNRIVAQGPQLDVD